MKKLNLLQSLALAVFIIGSPSGSQANCTSPVMIGSGSTCGVSRNQLCDFNDWATAANDCAGTYTDDLTFELYDYTDTTSGVFTTGYSLASGKTLTIQWIDPSSTPQGVSSKWNSTNQFISAATPSMSTGYALYVAINSGNVVLKDLQLYAYINNDWWGGNGVLLLKGNVTVEDCFIVRPRPTPSCC